MPTVHMLTAAGERARHPDYELDLSDEQYRELFRDMLSVRRWDTEATARRIRATASNFGASSSRWRRIGSADEQPLGPIGEQGRRGP